MDTWSKQSGFPVLTVKRDGEDLVISQKSFLLEKAESSSKFIAASDVEQGEDEEEEIADEYASFRDDFNTTELLLLSFVNQLVSSFRT